MAARSKGRTCSAGTGCRALPKWRRHDPRDEGATDRPCRSAAYDSLPAPEIEGLPSPDQAIAGAATGTCTVRLSSLLRSGRATQATTCAAKRAKTRTAIIVSPIRVEPPASAGVCCRRPRARSDSSTISAWVSPEIAEPETTSRAAMRLGSIAEPRIGATRIGGPEGVGNAARLIQSALVVSTNGACARPSGKHAPKRCARSPSVNRTSPPHGCQGTVW